MRMITMARDFSRPFYNSKAWKDCREGYIQSVNGLCERCLANGKYTPGYELHHKVWLTPENINDPYITLGWDNLEFLCSSCHSVEHMTKYKATRDDVMFDSEGQLIPK